MPALRETIDLETERFVLRLCRCDGRDPGRPLEEHLIGDRVVVPLRGRFRFRSRGLDVIAGPGCALFVPSGEPFEVSHPPGEGDVCLSVAGNLASHLVAAGTSARRLGRVRYLSLLSRLADERTRSEEPLGVESLLVEALAPAEPAEGHWSGRRDRAIAEVIAGAVEMRFHERVSLASLAAEAGVSPSHSSRAFRRVMGTSIHRYHLEVRLRHAAALLLDTRMPLADVALEVGFSNQGHFGNAFRALFGQSPRRMRTEGPGAGLGEPGRPGDRRRATRASEG